MPPETVDRLGEAFYQGGGGLTRQHAGTGLGLGIVKGILVAMDSELVVASTPGVGSRFSFELVLEKAKLTEPVNPFLVDQGAALHEKQWHDRGSGSTHTPSLLYVEDSEINRQVFAALLARFDVALTLAESAKEGLAMTRETHFDLIVTDIQMPDFSGTDLLGWLQNDPGANAGVPVVACTANASSQFREQYAASGFAGVLVKPVTLESLEIFLNQFLAAPLAESSVS